MKKILMAAILAVNFLISAPQVSAELVYTDLQDKTQYQGRTAHEKFYVDTDGIIDVKNGFSVDIVREIVETGDRMYEPISYVYLYKNGDWVVTTIFSDKIFNNTNTGLERKIGSGGSARLDSAIWNAAAPYAEKIKAKVIQRTQKNTPANSQVQFDGDISQLIAEADAKYKAKDYTAARQLFEQAVSTNPNDYHAHDLLARSLYREKNKEKDYDRIVDEVQQAVDLAPDNEKKADCLMFLSKVYTKLGMNNLLNTNNTVDYSGMSLKCQDMAQKLRQTTSTAKVIVPRASSSATGGSSSEVFVGFINKQRAFMLPNTIQYTGSKVQPDTMNVQVKIMDADDNVKQTTIYFKLVVAVYEWSLNQKDWHPFGKGVVDHRSNSAIGTIRDNAWQAIGGKRRL